MSPLKKRLAAVGVTALAAAGLAVATAGGANAATEYDQYCYFYRGSDQVLSIGPVHVGTATGDCSFVTFGAGFPGVNGHTGTIGVGHVYLGNGLWGVAEVDDLLGIAGRLADPGFNMPF